MLLFITRMFSPLTDVCRVIGRISALQRGNTSAGDLKSLITYYSLSHYTGISHATLASLYPGERSPPTPTRALTVFLQQVVKTMLHPRFLFFFPTFLVHLPAYLFGHLAGRYLANHKEEETQAQFKAIFGGLGFGLASGFVGKKLADLLLLSNLRRVVHDSWLPNLASWSAGIHEIDPITGWKRALGTLAVMLGTTKMLYKWHSALVAGS